jgi:hypothetical protein
LKFSASKLSKFFLDHFPHFLSSSLVLFIAFHSWWWQAVQEEEEEVLPGQASLLHVLPAAEAEQVLRWRQEGLSAAASTLRTSLTPWLR